MLQLSFPLPLPHMSDDLKKAILVDGGDFLFRNKVVNWGLCYILQHIFETWWRVYQGCLSQQFSTRMKAVWFLPPWEHLALSGDIFWRSQLEWCYLHLVSWGQGGYYTSYNTQRHPCTRNSLAQNINSAKAEKHWPRLSIITTFINSHGNKQWNDNKSRIHVQEFWNPKENVCSWRGCRV